MRLRAGVALATVAGLALAGCSSGSDEGTEPSSGTTSGGSQSTQSTEPVTISFHTWIPTESQWPDIIAAFQKENPNISIDVTWEKDSTPYFANLDNEIVADDIPDVFALQVGSAFDDYGQYALPVDKYADSSWTSKISDVALAQTTTSDGTLAAVPIINAGMEYYLYNKTILDKLGLEPPTTYDDLVKVSQAARAAGYSPLAMGAADNWHDADFFTWLSNQYGDGGDIYKAAKGEIPFESDSLVQAATAWQKLFTDGVFQDAATTTTTYPSARDDYFLAGKSIGFPTGSWHVSAALSISVEVPGTAVENDEIGMAVFPTIGPKDAGATQGVDFALAVSDNSDPAKQAAAEKFVQFMAVGTGQQLWVNMLQGFPVAKGVEIQVADDEKPLGKEAIKMITDTIAASNYARKPLSPDTAFESDLGVVLQNIAGGADPKTELATLDAKMKG
jgi:raffinose/stachyose/melibiose transport system substrate-binding protein